MNNITFNEVQQLILNMFLCGWLLFTAFEYPDRGNLQHVKCFGIPDDELYKEAIPVVKGHHMM